MLAIFSIIELTMGYINLTNVDSRLRFTAFCAILSVLPPSIYIFKNHKTTNSLCARSKAISFLIGSPLLVAAIGYCIAISFGGLGASC